MSLSPVIKKALDIYYWQTAVLIAKNGLARLYRNSFLGILWTLLQPLTMVMVYATIMPLIMRSTTPNYTLYVVVSLPLWGFFSVSIVGSSQSILANSETLKRCMISSSVFPIADVLRNTYTFFVSFITIYVVAMLLGIADFSATILLIPFYFIPILIIIGAAAIANAFIAPYIRDIGDVANIGMTVLFWMTPVVYQISMLPAHIQTLMRFNPFFIMLHPIQMLAYEHTVPGVSETLHLIALAVIAVVLGFIIFRACRRNYVYYL